MSEEQKAPAASSEPLQAPATFDEKAFLASYPQIAPKSVGSGHPGNLTEAEQEALTALRGMLESDGYVKRLDDATLLRFLRARGFDIVKAREMYVACEKWRKEQNVDSIITDFVYTEKSKVMQYYAQYYHKTDVDGRPVYYEDLSNVSYSKMLAITTMERMLKNLIWEYEAFTHFRLPACSRKVGYLLETSCTILDLKGISIGTARKVYTYISEASHIGQNYYPERMGRFYLINAPWGFSTVWAVISRFLDPVTVEKIHILGSSYQKELLKQIPVENLPVEYGGKSTTTGPIYMTDEGPWRDPKYVGPEGLSPVAGEPHSNPGADSASVTSKAATTHTTGTAASAGTASTAGTAGVKDTKAEGVPVESEGELFVDAKPVLL